MLLIALAAVSTASAQYKGTYVKNTHIPINVIRDFDQIIKDYGDKENQIYRLSRNPNTDILESKVQIVNFTCGSGSPCLEKIANSFMEDEPMSYQISHITPGNAATFSIKVIEENGKVSKDQLIRTKTSQEMWYMATKDPQNPQLRDVYAIVWQKVPENASYCKGTIFMISSLRPDIYQQNLENSSKTFKIEGRIDGEIKDSLYNVYIADSYEELNSLADDDYVACVPVVNKRFEYSVELDKPKAGRIRCIFPDGSLCSAWINLDMVPGETYRITVHNGYFDEDRDYEKRVGRYSGKSLIAGYDNDDNSSPVVLDEKGNVVEYSPAEQTSRPFANLTEDELATVQAKAQAIEERIKLVMNLWENGITKVLNSTSTVYQSGKRKEVSDMDTFFEQIIKHNEQIDKQFEDLLKTLNDYKVEKIHIVELIKEGILNEFLSKQNKALIGIYAHLGSLSKVGTKCQKQVNKLTEKYLNEMSKLM